MNPDTTDVAALLRLHEDERQIRNLVARLAHLADYGALDDYAECFTADASWEYVDGGQQGLEAILADRRKRRDRGTQGPGTRTRHVVSTTWVEVDGSDQATAHSYFEFVTDIPSSAIADADDVPVVHRVGRYRDAFRRTPDGWRLQHRHSTLSD